MPRPGPLLRRREGGGGVEVALHGESFGDANAMIRRSVFDRIGFLVEDYGFACQDWEFFARATFAGLKLRLIRALDEAAPDAVLAPPAGRARTVRRVPAGVQAARGRPRAVLRAGALRRRDRADHLRALQRLLRRPDREEAAQPLPARHAGAVPSAPRAATWPASSAGTGTSRSPGRSTRWPTRPLRRPSPPAPGSSAAARWRSRTTTR
jgi:hypothetical protein